MSDAGDDIQVEAAAEVEVAAEAPKGKLSVEDALKVRVGEIPSCLILKSHCSKFSRMPLFTMALLVVSVRPQRPWTSVRPIFASWSKPAQKPSTLSSSRPSAQSTRSTSSRSAMPSSLDNGLVSARSIERATPAKSLVAAALSSRTTGLKARVSTCCWTTSRTANVSFRSV